MPQVDYLILMGMGGLFALLGVVALVVGKREETDYYDSLSGRLDMREFLEKTPERPEPGALRIGGWLAISVGLIMAAIGGSIWYWGIG